MEPILIATIATALLGAAAHRAAARKGAALSGFPVKPIGPWLALAERTAWQVPRPARSHLPAARPQRASSPRRTPSDVPQSPSATSRSAASAARRLSAVARTWRAGMSARWTTKLLAAGSRDDAGRSNDILREIGEGHEHAVAGLVAPGVVHLLEAVEIAADHPAGLLRRCTAGDRRKAPAVQKTCQRIDERVPAIAVHEIRHGAREGEDGEDEARQKRPAEHQLAIVCGEEGLGTGVPDGQLHARCQKHVLDHDDPQDDEKPPIDPPRRPAPRGDERESQLQRRR
ncbi:hypothetical protein COLO4_02650 [Corchorus olitorius]|uniref:Secreted protein n=1 Tax=Corchorus olitorius TaxID=93759 RepID=A0A1R3L0K1_9ROSI|nr:hypothetical protein COLO4_02650 [Corchorus olitorius]